MDPGMDSDAYDCNYALGESFFLGLYHRIGHEQFRLGFRNLYLASTVEDPTDYYDEYEGTSVGIAHIGEAFQFANVAVSEVIARWYAEYEP